MRDRYLPFACLAALAFATAALAEEPTAKTYGWRGNWTGLYPDATPPTEWGRIAKGVVAGTTCQAARPADGAPKSGQPLARGMIRDWLVVGPLPVADNIADFDKEQIPGEKDLRPAEGDKVGDLAWARQELKIKPNYEEWGGVDLEWVDPVKDAKVVPPCVAYAHSYLFCARPGKITMVADHWFGMKVWVNGEVVYNQPKEGSGYGNHYGISRQKLALVNYHSPQFEMALKEGWNHILVKISSFRDKNSKMLHFTHCVYDSTPAYEEKNIAWMAEMPERTNACPIVVGDRIFTPAEPDELLCLDKKTGKVLWRRINSFYEAVPEAERQADPVLRDQVAPLAKELETTYDYEKGQELRRKIRDLLIGVDKKKYQPKLDGHMEAHFGIVGFTTTPVSDGKHVWAFYGFGVAACYDMDGKREWIARIMPTSEIIYSASPAIIGDRLGIMFSGIRGFDAATGKEVWAVPSGGIASLLPARINGTDVVMTQPGRLYRASDGKALWANPHIPPQGDMGWCPGAFLGDQFYMLYCGINQVIHADFSGVSGDEWKPKVTFGEQEADHHRPNGEWLDRFTPASPLVIGDTVYSIDQLGVFYVFDLKTQKSLYRHTVGFHEYHSYNAVDVAASPALGGKNIYVMDNQGMCVVVEPGPAWKPVATNRIETTIARNWPVNTQEITANGPPVFDGDKIYISGEKYLYCIGKK